jgi:heat shock protein HslJ
MKFASAILGFALLSLLAACAAAPGSAVSLVGTRWELQSADRGILSSKATSSGVTLEFAADRVSGYGGCNRYSSSYQLSGANLQLGSVVATKRGCMGDANAIESAWLSLLATALVVDASGGRLQLRAADGTELVFAPAKAES